MIRRRRKYAAIATLGAAVMIASTASTPSTFTPAGLPIALDRRGEGSMTRDQVRAWAASMGTDEAHAVMMAMLHSERGGSSRHRVEHRLIAETAINRLAFPQTFGRDLWAVIVNRPTTGAQGGRPYATTRPPRDPVVQRYLHEIAHDVITSHVPDPLGRNHYHHLSGSRAAEVNARWASRGYVAETVPGAAATFFRMTPSKAAGLA